MSHGCIRGSFVNSLGNACWLAHGRPRGSRPPSKEEIVKNEGRKESRAKEISAWLWIVTSMLLRRVFIFRQFQSDRRKGSRDRHSFWERSGGNRWGIGCDFGFKSPGAVLEQVRGIMEAQRDHPRKLKVNVGGRCCALELKKVFFFTDRTIIFFGTGHG